MVDFKNTPMTKEQANYVKWLRVDYGYSWRVVAGIMAKEWPEMNIQCHKPFNGQISERLDGYQSEGMDLCTEAAKFFGENAGDEPWN